MDLLDWLLSFFLIFIWIAWIWLVITILIDIFRSDDLSGWGKAGWSIFVIVVPLLDDETVLLAREYACGLHHYELGLPKGRMEAGETAEETANREMKEEIGYGARDLREINAFSLAPAYMSHVTHIVLARDLYPEKLAGDEPETIDVVQWSLHDLRTLAEREDCTEGRTIAALYYARDYLNDENRHD